jgi:hypothetical protein
MSTFSSSFQINGIIDTNQSVYKNIQSLATASGCWFTFDIQTGLWSVIINRTGTSVASFNDSNIIGNLNVNGKGIRELYNKVVVEFPHEDILNENDFTEYEIPSGDMFPNEMPNTLNFKVDLVSKPEHAQRLALQELKQSRVDKVIQFRTDFSELGLKAGDIIDVTSSMYDFSAKLFRVTEITEEDGDDNNIALGVTALEYDADVYDYADVFREVRARANGIIVKTINTATKTEDDKSMSTQLARMLAASAVTGLINAAFTRNPTTGVLTQALTNKTAGQAAQDAFSDSARADVLKKIKEPPVTISGATSVCEGANLVLTIAVDAGCACMLDLTTYEFSYTITGVQAADITPFPLTGKTKTGTMTIPIASDASAETETLTITIGSASKAVTINDQLSFTYVTTASPTSITEGATSTVTLTTTGVANGTSVPYAITGAGTGRVTTALTGNVTVNSNSATLSVVTTDDGAYTGDQTVTVTFNSAQADPCAQLDKTAVITIVDNDTAPAADTTCSYVSVPIIWCGQYDGADDQLKGVTALYSAMLPKALAGEATVNVPKTLTVTKGNPSTITVATTEAVASSALLGGVPLKVITTFNTVAPKGLITGSASSTVYGY